MKPIVSAMAGALTRRRVQTVMIGVVLLISTFAAVMALGLIVDSNAPFDKGFALERGAEVTASVDRSVATSAELARTARLPGVTAAAGPFAEADVTVTVNGKGGLVVSQYPMTVVGRASPGGPVDDLTLTSGHWPRTASQMILSGTILGGNVLGGSNPVGETVTVTSLPGRPRFTVVGFAVSVTASADGWVLPGQVARLAGSRTPATAEMLYRFRAVGTDKAVGADLAELRRALPTGAVTGTQSYLAVKVRESRTIALYVPFIVAFGVIGLIMSVLIVANVVSGAVVADYARIGVLKSIGFTPGQVVAVYIGQAAVPGAAGCLAGAVLGAVLANRLILGKTAIAYGVGTLAVPIWVVIATPVGMCLLAGLVALLPALRAGRLSAIAAIAAGRAPRAGRGYTAGRLASLLPLPRPLTLGLTAPLARPARCAMTLAAVLLGATAVTFAVGLAYSLARVNTGISLSNTVQLQIFPPYGPSSNTAEPVFSASQQRAAAAVIRSQPGTLRYVAESYTKVSVAGLGQPVVVTTYRGDARWLGQAVVTGRWYTRPGEADVPLAFLKQTGTEVGDTVTITVGGRRVPVRIVGEVFFTENRGLSMLTDWRTLNRAGYAAPPVQFDVGLRPGTGAYAYEQAISAALGRGYGVFPNKGRSTLLLTMIGLIGSLTWLLAVAAGLGVLNTVVVHTRERAHTLGVYKAVGMTPRQTIAMVVSWTAGIGLVAGILAVPAGIALHHYVLPTMAASVNVAFPASFLDVYRGPMIVLLALAGLIIATVGALIPASWAAGTPAATALRTE